MKTIQPRMKNPAMLIPEAMQPLMAFVAAVRKSGVSQRTLDLIHLRASQINGCSFALIWGLESLKRRVRQTIASESFSAVFAVPNPLGTNPLVVSGSANFSEASTTDNDENMLIIRGNPRVADIYLGEFMRLYRHFAFRD